AVMTFQRERGLPANGLADPATRELVAAFATVAALQPQQAERDAPDVERAQQAPEPFMRQAPQPAPAADWTRHDPRLLNAQHYTALKTQFPQFTEEQLTAYTAAIHKAGIPPDEPLYKTKLWDDGTLSISTAKAQYPRFALDTNAPVPSIAESAQAVMAHDQQNQAEREQQQEQQRQSQSYGR
ncbi:MAG TPA: hypothetical protein VGD42_03830, partial [Lysobacter sp.]